MRITRQHILIALTAVMTLITACGNDEGEVIPRKKMAKIYAEMLVTDQWINSTPEVRKIADTSLVYEPILEKYGYDSKDYRKTVDRYMDDPERFSRIFREAGEILGEKIVELKLEQVRLEALANLPKIEYDYTLSELAPCLADEPYYHTYDSLAVGNDSITMIFKVFSIERSDTLYEGLRMIIRDSVVVGDTVKTEKKAIIDTVELKSVKADLHRSSDSLKSRMKLVRKPENLKIK